MKILFMHPNMPGQYKYLCQAFASDPKNQVVFVAKTGNFGIPNVKTLRYQAPRNHSPHAHRYLVPAEQAVIQGQEVWRVLSRFKKEQGFVPDVICAHPGWGDALYVKDVYPDTPLLGFFEFFYHAHGADVGFDPADQPRDDDVARVRTKNMHHYMGLNDADWGITPTFWQHSLHPEIFQKKISVIHDGISTKVAAPNPKAQVTVRPGLTFKPGDEVVTYIARNFEPYRGFPTFMQAAEIILKERPNCHIIAVGADDVSYGKKAPEGKTYREIWSSKVKLDNDRIHFVGTVPYQQLMTILQVSAAHIYLTYPFVLSWSLLESMAIGCAVVGSDTQPLREVINHGQNGFLVDFFSPRAVADQVAEILDHPTRMQHIREQARRDTVQKYDLDRLLPLHVQLVRDVAERRLPPPTQHKIDALYLTKEAA